VLNLPYVKDMLSKFIEGTEYRMQLKALASVRDPPVKDALVKDTVQNGAVQSKDAGTEHDKVPHSLPV